MSLGERLRKAVNLKYGSIRSFHKELEGRKVKGGSYPQVHRYLADKSTPSIAFLTAASEVLRVRRQWLLTGEGGMTPVVRVDTPLWLSGAALEATDRWVDEVMAIPELGDAAGNYAEDWHAFISRLAHVPQVAMYPPGHGPSEDAFSDYVLALISAMNVLVRDRQREGPLPPPATRLSVLNENLMLVGYELHKDEGGEE